MLMKQFRELYNVKKKKKKGFNLHVPRTLETKLNDIQI